MKPLAGWNSLELKGKILVILFFLLFGLGFLFPGSLWGLDAFSFLTLPSRLILGGCSIFAAFFGTSLLERGAVASGKWPLAEKWLPLLLFPLLSVSLAYIFPIAGDTYGDSRYIQENLNLHISQWDPRILDGLKNFNLLDLKIGEQTFYALANLCTFLTGWSGIETLYLVSAICLGLFQVFWILLVNRLQEEGSWKWVFYLVGFCAPFTLFFHGHMEIYAPAFVVFAAFSLAATGCFQHPTWTRKIVVSFLFLLCIKFHITGIFFFPVAILAWFPETTQKLTARGLEKSSLYYFIPAVVIGILVYLFVTKSFHGPREWDKSDLYGAVFLPVRAAEGPPLDRYNLFSWAHFLDYFNLWFVWSPPMVFLGTFTLAFRKRLRIDGTPFQLAFLLAFGGFFLGYFVLNPLLSMPGDVDLFSLPAISFMVLILAIWSPSGSPDLVRGLKGPVAGLSLMGYSFLLVHLSPGTESGKVLSMGKYLYKTYWKGSSDTILDGIRMSRDSTEQAALLEAVITELKPYAVKKTDYEYGELIRLQALPLMKSGQFQKANEIQQYAYQYGSNLTPLNFDLLNSHFMLGEFDYCIQLSEFLIRNRYPNYAKALRMGVHSAIEAENLNQARIWVEEYLAHFPDDQFMRRVANGIDTTTHPENLKEFFQRGN